MDNNHNPASCHIGLGTGASEPVPPDWQTASFPRLSGSSTPSPLSPRTLDSEPHPIRISTGHFIKEDTLELFLLYCIFSISLVFYTVWFYLTFALLRMYYCIIHITYLFYLYLYILLILIYIILVVHVLIVPWVREKRIFKCSVCLAHIAELTLKFT